MTEPRSGTAHVLPSDSGVGAVYLRVRDLAGVSDFYQQALGLTLLSSGDAFAELGVPGRRLVGLIAAPQAVPAPRAPGLYHLALLLPDRAALGRFLRHAIMTRVRLQGASDHLVSEAIYLADPEGNGIEVYRDRPRAEWKVTSAGVEMASDPLDAEGLLEAGGSVTEPYEAPAETRIGHVHLQVSSLPLAQARYSTEVGLDVTSGDYPGALFMAAGGYHHHLGANTWRTQGALPRPRGLLGLAWFELQVPSVSAREGLTRRLEGEPGAEESGVAAFPARVYHDRDGIGMTVVGG